MPSGYVSLDASRPWLLFWTLHSLELLGALTHLPLATAERCIDFLVGPDFLIVAAQA